MELNIMADRIIRVLHLTIPAMISSAFGVIAFLFCTRVLGHYDKDNYYLLAAFMPVNYMLFAIYEAIRASALFLSSRQREHKHELAINILSLTFSALSIFIIFLIAFFCVSEWIGNVIGVYPTKKHDFTNFSCLMIISGTVTSLFYVFSSTFFAIKKPIIGMTVSLIASVLTCLCTFLFSELSTLSWHGYIFSTIISYLIAISLSLILLSFEGISVISCLPNNFAKIMQRQRSIIKIGSPVLLTYLLIFSSLFFINAALSYFDESILTGFSVAYRIQNIAILPAITLGTAIAILVNQARVENNFKEEYLIKVIGFVTCFLLYFIIAIAIYYYSYSLLALIVSEQSSIKAGLSYFNYVSLTYIALGPNLAYLTYLEQSGAGIKSLVINLYYFVIAVGVGCVGAVHYHQYIYLYKVIALINIIFFIYLLFSLGFKSRPRFFKKYTNRKDVRYV
ncbi:MATE family efflux transporter [Legionella sp. km535]|nr:MATE family efflux transporter [Legionella sp. km535]